MRRKPTVAIRTLGCKLNQAESESLARDLSQKGYDVISGDKANVFVINTCTVTHIADRKSRHLVRMLRKQNPHSLIVVTGCYAERAETDLGSSGADLIVKNHSKVSLPAMLEDKFKEVLPCVDYKVAEDRCDKVRSFIKIQDGCRNFCSYCIVPFVRREIYSLDIQEIVNQVRVRVSAGYKEVVLTGTEIGSYGSNGSGLKDLIKCLLQETGIERLHLSSLQPQEITEELLDLWQSPRMCRHFHVALQSGSDTVLNRMRRCYDTRDYEKAVDSIRAIMPDASVTTDVMVGFPREDGMEFQESYDFCQEMKFAAMHVFVYSSRPCTLAANMTGKINEKVKKERSLRMLGLAAHSIEEFAEGFVGRVRNVLWENEVKPSSGIFSGLTDNYIRVYTRNKNNISNMILKTKLLASARDMRQHILRASTKGNYGELWGEVVA